LRLTAASKQNAEIVLFNFLKSKLFSNMKQQNKKAKLKLNKKTLNNLTTESQAMIKGGTAKCAQNAAGEGTCASMINTSCTGSGRPACI
jgi:hypothetical protein